MTREEIEQLNGFEPYCIETDREQSWYEFGLVQGLETADANPKSPWISVKDDLPCNHPELLEAKYQTKKVFIMKDLSGNPDVDYMLNVDGKWRWSAYNGTKYWFPIPEPPKE